MSGASDAGLPGPEAIEVNSREIEVRKVLGAGAIRNDSYSIDFCALAFYFFEPKHEERWWCRVFGKAKHNSRIEFKI